MDHPALQKTIERPLFSRQQTPLLPPPFKQNVHSNSIDSGKLREFSLGQSEARARATSSVYSQSTSGSSLSRDISTMSSFSEFSSDGALHTPSFGAMFHESAQDIPAIPAIPDQYRHPSHSLRNGGQPVRPGSRPGFPPPDFWMFDWAEQQSCNLSPIARSQTARSDLKSARPRTGSSCMAQEATSCPTSPEKAVLRSNLNGGNTMRIGKRSYESVRKDQGLDSEDEHSLFLEDKPIQRDSRTLVKKRQPWDGEPRWEKMRL